MKPQAFKKMSGAGNIFYISVDDNSPSSVEEKRNFVKNICSTINKQTFADGVLWLSKAPPSSSAEEAWVWDFYNADGSSAEMCGNAARCAAHLLMTKKLSSAKKIKFETLAGSVFVERLKENSYQVEMPPIKTIQKQVSVSDFFGDWIDSGVPHFVINIKMSKKFSKEDFDHEKVSLLLTKLKTNPYFGNAGTNITVFENKENFLTAKTFERGVDSFTQACGTGAVAAAYVAAEGRPGAHKVSMPGGELTVVLREGQNPLLIGPAEFLET